MHHMSQKRIAVVGSGVSGLSAAWLLHKNGHAVTLYESESSCGGHTLTDTTSPYPVDLGFQVYNFSTYPHLVGFFEALGVDTEPSDMSFALSLDGGRLEWASHDLSTVFAQRKNAYSLSFYSMIYDVVKFGRRAPEVLEPQNHVLYKDMTLRTYLQRNSYSKAFVNNYLLPMCAAVWSVPNSQVMQFPIQMLVRFWVNHHLLDLIQRPMWRVVKGRSREYVKKVLADLPDVRTSTPVASVVRLPEGMVEVTTREGQRDEYEAVVLATHSDVSLKILGEGATPQEKEVLGAVPYNENDVWLHTDDSLMPRDHQVWASWNFLGRSGSASADTSVCVSYWVNRLQHLPPGAPQMFVTLNPLHPPAEDKVIRRLTLSHPVFSFTSWSAQQRVAELQGQGGVFYVGAWCGYGFHEDGIKSAVEVVQLMGGRLPWVPRSTSPKSSLAQQLYRRAFHHFASRSLNVGHLRLVLPNGEELEYGDPSTVEAPLAPGDDWRGIPRRKATVRVMDMDFFRKIVTRHDTGLGEAYMAGDFQVDSLGGLMALLTANAPNMNAARGALGALDWVGDRLLYLAHLQRSNTIEGSRRNIEEHYDAGNAMYQLFLDESMTYSSGVHHKGDDLHQAQMNKLDALIVQADLKEGDNVLEIGCGWGSMAIRAVQKTGCRWTGLTLSKEQLAEATKRVQAAGLSERITLMFCDYRDCPGAGTYDKVISCEMIEAVGHEHLQSYFSQIGKMLKTGGRAVIQAISMPDERYSSYCKTSDFIRAHIFPGGHLPSMGAMVEAARGTGLEVQGVRDIGPDYALTLREWRRRWEVCQSQVLELGYSETFWRKYRFYFAYCEAAFDARYLHNFQILWVKTSRTPEMTEQEGSHQLGGVKALVKSELPQDPVTQVLLAVYFFLAGLIVQCHPYLWLLPTIFTLCSLTNMAFQAVATSLLAMTPQAGARWSASMCHLTYSCLITLVAGLYLVSQPQALRLDAPPQGLTLPSVIVCSSTGFYAFYLWCGVRTRVYLRSPHSLLHYTFLLVICGVAAYKNVHLAFLSAMLTSEAHSVVVLMGRVMPLTSHPAVRKVLDVLQGISLITFRLIPHLVITLMVVRSGAVFSSVIYHILAVAGMMYCNIINFRQVAAMITSWSSQRAAGKVKVQ